MKNFDENLNNGSFYNSTTFYRKTLDNIILQADTLSIIAIMLGGLIAIGRDSRPIGIVIIVAGFAGLFFHIRENISAHKQEDYKIRE